jgi:hypothetical protein
MNAMRFRRVRALCTLCFVLVSTSATGAELPWEYWKDLRSIARLPSGDQVLLRSSRCPSGCRFDRTSDGDPRFLRVAGDEAVIFDEPGAGAITRIWMTMGPGVSEPLDPSIRVRIRLDGEPAPRIDLPLQDLFRGDVPPFLPPLVADRLTSSGGNVSYVPIPYRKGCVVSLVGALQARIWYQITFHRLDRANQVTTFTGNEDLQPLSALLSAPGTDPWPSRAPELRRTPVRLVPGQTSEVWRRQGPGLVQALRLRGERRAWDQVWITLDFDGKNRVEMPLRDFFAVGQGGATPTRSLLVGADASDVLYSYFPMPFFAAASVRLTNRAAGGEPPLDLELEVGWNEERPAADLGVFGAARAVTAATAIGRDFPFLDLAGRGKWVGFFAELAGLGTASREYLEGDERVYLDGALHPGLYGTGVEDLFNGGFYFDQGAFGHALYGAPYLTAAPDRENVTAAYRLLLADGVPFQAGLRAGLESGPTNNLQMRARTVAWYYTQPRPALRLRDRLDPGSAASRRTHEYSRPSNAVCRALTAQFESEPPVTQRIVGCSFTRGSSRFILRRPRAQGPLRLRRILDAGSAGQEADVFINGAWAGAFPYVDRNEFRRWRQVDLDLPPGIGGNAQRLEIVVVPRDPSMTFTEYGYELWGS